MSYEDTFIDGDEYRKIFAGPVGEYQEEKYLITLGFKPKRSYIGIDGLPTRTYIYTVGEYNLAVMCEQSKEPPMDSRYTKLSPEDQVIEECAELILTIQKLRRFGRIGKDPYTGIRYDNLKKCTDEIADVRQAITELEASWVSRLRGTK